MPWKTVKRGKKLVNVNARTGEVKGTFPRTAEGHARAGAQISIMERAEGIGGKGKRRRRKVWVGPRGER